ncbi:uncharacterized protein LOC136042117 [Artemia franciscana]|uniref:Uncharacterized protein n=1 Tax=Artemia franciscana TaxID=6661 RepID=A0AA88H2H1_ARTSF|nr:hypothetical protein QYM36_018373 [Artemia franciscana]
MKKQIWILFFLHTCFLVQSEWISIFPSKGGRRRHNLDYTEPHLWGKNSFLQGRKIYKNYDISDEIQGDDPLVWRDDADHLIEIESMEYNVGGIKKTVPSSTIMPPELFTKSLVKSTNWNLENSIVNEATPANWLKLFPKSESKEVTFPGPPVPVSRHSSQINSVNDTWNERVLEEELEELEEKRGYGLNTKQSLHATTVSTTSVLKSLYKNDKLKANNLGTLNPNSRGVANYDFLEKKNAHNYPFEVELKAAESVKRKLFQSRPRSRQNFLAPIDLIKMKDFDSGFKEKEVQFTNKGETAPNSIKLQDNFSATELPIPVLNAAVYKNVPIMGSKYYRKHVIESSTEIIQVVKNLTHLPEDLSLAELFPTLPPLPQTTLKPRRATRLPYFVSDHILSSIKARRAKGRAMLPSSDYSPLPYGIDYRAYQGPKSLYSKLRFQSDSSENIGTTQKNLVLHVPDAEISDTGRASEIYRFVGRKPRPTTTKPKFFSESSIDESSSALVSVISFFKSLLGNLPE